jgi:RHS repeat-associated protein
VTGTYSYGSYGAVTRHTGTVTTALQYDGQYTDAESGLQYLRARYYNPSTGQFVTLDPAIDTTYTPYSYASGNPVNADDPSGKCPWCVAAVIGGIIGAGAGVVTGALNCAFTNKGAGECAQEIVSDAVGGAVGGACTGGLAFTPLAPGAGAICGAVGSVVTDATKQFVFGQDVSVQKYLIDAGAAAILGQAGDKLGKAIFPRGPGRPPTNMSNLWNPGKIAKWYWKSGIVGAVPGLVQAFLPDCL